MMKKIIVHLSITIFMILSTVFNVFAPYYLAFVFPKENKMELGIHYYYSSDVNEVSNDLYKISEDGFTTIKINFHCTINDDNSGTNNATDYVLDMVDYFNLKVALIVLREDASSLSYYLSRWGDKIDYIQVLNEPELAKGFGEGALLLDDEIYTPAKQIQEIVISSGKNISLYTNFSVAFMLRSNLVIFYSKNITCDFLGLDVYMDVGLKITPFAYSNLQKLSRIDNIIISEFGIDTTNENVKASFIIEGLNFFKSYGVRECWLCYWSDGISGAYGIKGTEAETQISAWIKNQK